MLSDPSIQNRESRHPSWVQSFQGWIQNWIRQEIIDEDPYDEEKLTAQVLYEQLQQLEQALPNIQFQPLEQSLPKVQATPIPSCSMLR